MKLAKATKLAESVKALLEPHCHRIEIAGSIRRKKAEVGDIEIVCIPCQDLGGLFGDEPETSPEFCRIVNWWLPVKGKPTGKYTQRVLPEGIKLDLFMPDARNWGLIFAIRTGSADFSYRRLACRWAKLGYKSVEGRLHNRFGEPVDVPEEKDLFKLLGLRFVAPERRE